MPEAARSDGGALTLRPPETVMRLERMGSFHQTRLSFMRSLLRRAAREAWRLERERFDFDAKGVGTAVYALHMPAGVVRLIAFGHKLAPEERSDRVIAEKWDSTFALTTAEPDRETVERLFANVPKQEAGRCSPRELVLSRANKSVRLFDSVVDALAAGEQPAPERIVEVGYLMRTTAVYGNGKFGLSDLANTFGGGLFSRPFEAEMLTVYLIREYTFDLVAHLARSRDPARAVPLSAESKRLLGIGNATGLGMAPFLIGHPLLIGRWLEAREVAIARVCAQTQADPDAVERVFALLDRAIHHVGEWHTADPRQSARIETLAAELPAFAGWLQQSRTEIFEAALPWQRLAEAAAARLSIEGQELINSLLLEPHGALIDDLEDSLSVDETADLDPSMSLSALRRLIEANYDWALPVDYDDPHAQHFFWYVSEEKLEPRLGARFEEPGAEREQRLGIGREVKRLHEAICAEPDPDQPLAALLLRQPDLRRAARRVQALARQPYAEIRDNLIGAEMLAIDLLRCKLSIFGAIRFDPKSDRWTRITMYQGAPGFEDLDKESADDWAFPVLLPSPA